MGLFDIPFIGDVFKTVASKAPSAPAAPAAPSLADILPLLPTSGGGGGGGYSGGGGGSSYVDHFFDINPLDQAQFDLNRDIFALDQDIFDFNRDANIRDYEAAQAQQQWQNEFDQAANAWKQSMDERNYALAIGDQDLARQKQADANYWQGVQTQLEQQSLNLQNQGQQLDYSAKMANIAQQREASNQQFQIGMAGAANDAERNAIQDRWNRQQALIAQMEDQTRRLLGGQQNQTAQFSAETERAGTMGNLALENNKFIAEMARSPRDLFSLFFLQRGMTPDWDTMAAGGTPATGDALVPVNPMTAYNPVTAPASGFNLPASNLQIVSGGSAGASGNKWLSGAASGGSSSGGGGAAVPTPSFLPMMDPNQSYAPPAFEYRDTAVYNDINPGGKYGGTPDARLSPGMNLSTVGGPDITGKNFMVPGQTAYYDREKTRPIGENDVVLGGSQVWIDYQPERMAAGGYTTARRFMTGDAAHPNPSAGGAVPEIVENPTGAPIRVNPNPANIARAAALGLAPKRTSATDPGRMGAGVSLKTATPFQQPVKASPPASTTGFGNSGGYSTGNGLAKYDPSTATIADRQRAAKELERAAALGLQQPVRDLAYRTPAPGASRDVLYRTPVGGVSRAVPEPFFRATAPNVSSTPEPFFGGDLENPMMRLPRPAAVPAVASTPAPTRSPAINLAQYLGRDALARLGINRFALGTDAQAQYQATGMGSTWMPSSNNQHLAGVDLPTRLQMLAQYGAPISPALAASVTGGIAPTLNMGSAFTVARQAGVLPSLQTLSKQTKSETEAFRGYAEGVSGLPWGDLIDYLQKPTANLGKAQLARAA